ncbi:Beta-galactosidase [Acidisarcina polymorpha]|uniref:Beta-galactosidase n=1 Tax=Acidisarcina polymorpha TaxID=2211140 RepID=A0A2Z5G5D6_9BACT|nr:sugar-binding domain-containing protein [Acidisarcina polymorpha]AXC14159.1 Beta-galactosidase [Acidisarcina polymorpha]
MWSRFVALPVLFAIGSSCLALSATLPLREGWELQSGCKTPSQGDAISTAGFDAKGWSTVNVPSTVLAAQVASGEFKDPYYSDNLRKIPGTTYPVGDNFSNLPMAADSPYRCSWWYRKQFNVPAAEKGSRLWLRFGGINYRANLWVNGKRIAEATQVAGAYRTYEFDVTESALPGKTNVVAVETFAPTETDLGINWVDWNPCPPDKDMGLTGAVDLVSSGPVTVRSPLVVTHITGSDGAAADLTAYVQLHNASTEAVKGNVLATIAGVSLKQAVELQPGEDKEILFDPQTYPELHLKHPALWWPYQMGSPHLETASVSFVTAGKVSDEQSVRFGIREVTSELTDKGFRLFKVNGKPILIRGAGWSQDMLLRENPQHLEQQFRLVEDMHLNTIRLEGKLETEHFFQLADEQGILVMLGWCCCDQWEHWDKWTAENHAVSTASLRSQMLRLRHHASLLVWLNGSDNPPPADVEKTYLDVESQTRWPNPILSSATQAPTTVTGKSGVKMTGPYDYVAPSYWLTDANRYGGAYGFNTETSPGPAIPTLSSLKKFIPASNIWPPDDIWSLHYGGEGFKKLTVYNEALEASYGPAKDLDDYLRVSQTMAYTGERAMFEAYGRNKYTSTGVIQWMLNNAWPSMIWHLYDYYLDAGGGYYGAKKACEPLHVQYSYDDHSVFVVNSDYHSAGKLNVSVELYDLHMQKLYSQQATVVPESDSSVKALTIPQEQFSDKSPIYFVELLLKDAQGATVSRNFYWVPSKLTEFAWEKTDYTHTPAVSHEDLTALRQLPKTKIESSLQVEKDGTWRVNLHNPSTALAFQVSVDAVDATGQDMSPMPWSDNYVELMPGETRTLSAKPPAANAGASIVVSGWNIPSETLKAAPQKSVPQNSAM